MRRVPKMEFQKGGHYRIVARAIPVLVGEFDATYVGPIPRDSEEETLHHNFVLRDHFFLIGIGEDQVGSLFEIEGPL